MVTGIHQQNVIVLRLQVGLNGCDDVVAQIAIDVGMHVIGVEDDDVVGLFTLGKDGNRKGQHQSQCQQHCENLAHD